MESESRMPRDEAARALAAAEAVQARAAGVPRGHAVLQLLYGVLMSAFVALFVYWGSDPVRTETIRDYLMVLVLPPVIISSRLIAGANYRYAGRLRATRRYWLSAAVFFAMLALLVAWRVVSGGYPSWVVPVSSAVTLVIFCTRPLMIISRTPAERLRASSVALPRAVRVSTIVMGALLGAVCATASEPLASDVLLIVVMVLVIASLMNGPSWGLPAVGWYWGFNQWVAFSIAVAGMLLLATLIVVADVVSLPLCVGMGVVVAVSLIASAFRPGQGEPDDDFDYEDAEEPADGAPET